MKGIGTDEETKERMKKRAERFGVHDVSYKQPNIDREKKIARAERFGIAAPEREVDRRKLREQRFGNVVVSDKDKKLNRAKRFNLYDRELEKEKLKARAQRFQK